MQAILAWAFIKVRARVQSALAYSLAFKAIDVFLLAPIAALVLRTCLTRWGKASVGNFEIAAFLLSPIGLVALVGVGSILLATLYLELAGLMKLLADSHLAWWRALSGSAARFHRLLELGLRQLVAYLLLAIPFLAVIGVAYAMLWKGRDLNGLIVLKPPLFWQGAAVVAVSLVVYAGFSLSLFARWLLAVPTLLFEPHVSATQVLQLSSQRSRGHRWHFLAVLATWAMLQSALAMLVLSLLHGTSRWLLSRVGDSLALAVPLSGLVLAVNLAVSAGLSVLANTTFAAVVLSLYRESVGDEFLRNASTEPRSSRTLGWRLAGILALLTVVAVVLSSQALRNLKLRDPVEITAHRAGATAAPENTIGALKQAIIDRADWAEIDVQLTSDQALVVMHDTDLARVGGGTGGVGQTTLAKIQELDVGTLFGSQFAGERIPTFEEFLEAARDNIRLNVELKPHGKTDVDLLTRKVVAAIQAAEMVSQCRICSQSYESLQIVRTIEPALDLGYIAGAAIGDLTQLDVQFLMVKSSHANRQLVERARLHNIAIHAWTVNDPALVGPLLEAGVANIITDDPASIRARMDEIQALDAVERLILSARQRLY